MLKRAPISKNESNKPLPPPFSLFIELSKTFNFYPFFHYLVQPVTTYFFNEGFVFFLATSDERLGIGSSNITSVLAPKNQFPLQCLFHHENNFSISNGSLKLELLKLFSATCQYADSNATRLKPPLHLKTHDCSWIVCWRSRKKRKQRLVVRSSNFS